MNREDIIRMAREAGISKPWDQEPVKWETLDRFAALVAAAEREACAKVCDELVTHTQSRGDGDATLAAFSCAAAIRARGQG
jgi:hypothetical protein